METSNTKRRRLVEKENEKKKKLELEYLSEIEELQINGINNTSGDKERDLQRLQELRSFVKDVPKFIVTTLPGESHIFLLSSYEDVQKKVAQWLGTIVPCLQFEYDGSVWTPEAAHIAITSQHSCSLTVVNQASLMESTVRIWPHRKWFSTWELTIDFTNIPRTACYIDRLTPFLQSYVIRYLCEYTPQEHIGLQLLRPLLNTASEAIRITSLHIACKKRWGTLVQLLLDLKTPFVSHANEKSDTPLHAAARAGDIFIIELLQKVGASGAIINSQKQTPLHVAFFPYCNRHRGDIDINDRLPQAPSDKVVTLLINARCNLDAVDHKGYTVLDLAMQEESWQSTQKILITHGAPLNTYVRFRTTWNSRLRHYTPLRRACLHESKEMIEYLVTHRADLTFKDESGRSVLHWIILNKTEGTIPFRHRQLQSIDADDESSDSFGGSIPSCTLEQTAWERDLGPLIAHLIQNSAEVNAQDNLGESPLFSACVALRRPKMNDAVRTLVEAKANVNKQNHAMKSGNQKSFMGFSPLHLISAHTIPEYSEQENTSLAELFLAHGADVDITTMSGETPLHTACSFLNPAWISALLKRGSRLNVQDDFGDTPLHKLSAFDEVDLPNFNERINRIIDECLPLVFQYDISSLSIRNKFGSTPLETARIRLVKFHSQHEIKHIIQRYIDALEYDNTGLSHVCTESGNGGEDSDIVSS